MILSPSSFMMCLEGESHLWGHLACPFPLSILYFYLTHTRACVDLS